MFSTQIQAFLKEFLTEPGILKMAFDSIFCNFPQLWFVLVEQFGVWSKRRQGMTHSELTDGGQHLTWSPFPPWAQNPFLQLRSLTANPALGLNMRTPGNEGFHLVRPKRRAVSFANQTSYHATRVPPLWWERVHIHAGSALISHKQQAPLALLRPLCSVNLVL